MKLGFSTLYLCIWFVLNRYNILYLSWINIMHLNLAQSSNLSSSFWIVITSFKAEVFNLSGLTAQREGEQLPNRHARAQANEAAHTGAALAALFMHAAYAGIICMRNHTSPATISGPVRTCANRPPTPAQHTLPCSRMCKRAAHTHPALAALFVPMHMCKWHRGH